MSPPSERLQGKIVLITGASGGLGEQIAYEAAKKGATVVLTARREGRLKMVKKCCEELSGEIAYFYPLDVGDSEKIAAVLDAILADLPKIDVLVNNAGFGLFAPALEMPRDSVEEMFRVNVLALIQITQIVAFQMKRQGSGHIINIASQASKMATPKSAVYAATKFAVRGYSNALRLELNPLGIRVTTVNTGPLRTDFFQRADQSGSYLNKLGRWVLDPKDVADRVADCMLTDKREINLPWLMELGSRLYELFPPLGDYLASTLFNKK